MPVFSFEIAQEGKRPFLEQDQSLADIAAVWCQVEALAVMAKDFSGASIRVRNAEGCTLIFTGVATALATIEKCRRPDCPLGNVKGTEKAAYRSHLLPAKLLQH
jgi:hypothetical protein